MNNDNVIQSLKKNIDLLKEKKIHIETTQDEIFVLNGIIGQITVSIEQLENLDQITTKDLTRLVKKTRKENNVLMRYLILDWMYRSEN
jgi:hypothetical protein